MLYRRRGGLSGRLIRNLIVAGVLLGVGFVAFDNFFGGPADSDQPTATPGLQVGDAPTQTPVASPLAPPTNAPTPAQNPFAGIAPSEDTSIFIASIGVNAPVITAILRDSTWDVTQLGTNVGYLQGTSWVGDVGNMVLSGHVEMSDGRTGVFSTLDEIAIGDTVIITENGQEYAYVVRETKYVDPTDLSVVYPTRTETLTLITCSDYNFLSNAYETRFVVIADRV